MSCIDLIFYYVLTDVTYNGSHSPEFITDPP